MRQLFYNNVIYQKTLMLLPQKELKYCHLSARTRLRGNNWSEQKINPQLHHDFICPKLVNNSVSQNLSYFINLPDDLPYVYLKELDWQEILTLAFFSQFGEAFQFEELLMAKPFLQEISGIPDWKFYYLFNVKAKQIIRQSNLDSIFFQNTFSDSMCEQHIRYNKILIELIPDSLKTRFAIEASRIRSAKPVFTGSRLASN